MLHPLPSRRPHSVALPSDALPPACLAVREQLQAYVDEALDAPHRAALLAHLVACDRCTAAETGLRRCVERLQRVAALQVVPAPRSLRVRASELFRQQAADDDAPDAPRPPDDVPRLD